MASAISTPESDSSRSKADRCVKLLTDDFERQSRSLSVDDVNRLVSRMQLNSLEIDSVWTQLATAGVTVDDLTGRHHVEPTPTAHDDGGTNRSDDRWYRAFGDHGLLSQAEEVQLGRRLRAARAVEQTPGADLTDDARRILQIGETARATLMLSNVRLVIHCAKKYSRLSTIPIDDLVQDGIVGLSRAIERYDPERGFRFSTYARWWIESFISRAVDNTGRIIRVPAHIQQRLNKLRRKRRRMSSMMRRAPTPSELSRELGCLIDEVELLLRIESDVVSLDTSESTDGSTIADRTPSRVEAPDKVAERRELTRTLRRLLKSLDERSRAIVVRRFGLNGKRPKTLEQIGETLGITRERVRQIEKRALERMSRGRRARLLRQFLDVQSTLNIAQEETGRGRSE